MRPAATGPKSHPPLPAPEPREATSALAARAGTASGGCDLGDGGHRSVTSARYHGSERTRDYRLGRRQPGAYPPLTGPVPLDHQPSQRNVPVLAPRIVDLLVGEHRQ